MPSIQQIAPELHSLRSLLQTQSTDGKLHGGKLKNKRVLFTQNKSASAFEKARVFAQDVFTGKNSSRKEVNRILDGAAAKASNPKTLRAIEKARQTVAQTRSLNRLNVPINEVIQLLEEEFSSHARIEAHSPLFGKAQLRSFESLDPVELDDHLRKAARGDLKPLAKLLGAALGSELAAKDFPGRLEILISMEEGKADSIAEELMARAPQPLSRSAARQAVQMAIDEASRPLFGFVDPTQCERAADTGKSGNIGGFSIPGQAGDQGFKTVKLFDNGGFASAGLFRREDEEVVLKWPQSDSKRPTANAEILKETLLMHKAHAQDPRFVMEPKYLVRIPAGWALAMEPGHLGSLYGISAKLGDDNEAKQLLARQCVEMAVTMERAGVYHLDFKEPNIFLRNDGTPGVADFGAATTNEKVRSMEIPENPDWLDPSARTVVQTATTKIRKLEAPVNELSRAFTSQRQLHWKKTNREFDPELLALHQKALADAEQTIRQKKNVLSKGSVFWAPGVDRWSLGIILIGVLGSKSPFDADFSYEREAKIDAFWKEKEPAKRAEFLRPALENQTDAIRKLILDLLDPNPTARPAPSTIDLSVFNVVANITPEKEQEIRERIAAGVRGDQPAAS